MNNKTFAMIFLMLTASLAGCLEETDAIEEPITTVPPEIDITANNSTTTGPLTHPIDINGMSFAVSEITIPVGDTILWTNLDNAPHTVTADDGSFDSGTMSNGGTYSVTFDDNGTYTYKCDFHPSMTGTIIVGDGGEVDDGNETTDGGNETTNGGNETTTNNTTTGNAHCLILDNATMNQTHYITVDLVNTCSDAIMYPGINATSDSSEVTGLYDIWWYVIGDNSTIQMGWQLSINETVENGSVITLYFEAFILNCGPENSWNDDCPNSNIYYPFTVFNNNTDGNETTSNVTHYIDISGMSFNPGTITINVGDTIIWTNNESSMPHTVTADNGNFDSGTLNSGDTFTFTFTEAGTYTYHCAFHSGMTATIIVE